MKRLALIASIAVFAICYIYFTKPIHTPAVVANNQPVNKIKILLVAGHDNDTWGTQFLGVKEVELNRLLAGYLFDFLKNDPLFEVTVNQENDDYIPELKNFFEENEEKIVTYRKERRDGFKKETEGRDIDADVVEHNKVTDDVANKLYGTNMWAEEKDFDLLLHTHFNDYPGRPKSGAGKYFGFVVYAPDDSLKNHNESLPVAHALYNELAKYQPKSNLPVEKDGVIESKDLIALGARNSLSIPAVLIEYAYIAEPRLQGEGRDGEIKKMAEQTYVALKEYYGKQQK